MIVIAVEAIGRQLAERSARRGENNPLDGLARPPFDTLEDRVVLAVDRQQTHAVLAHRASHDLAGDDQHFLIGEGDILAGLDRSERRRQTECTDQRRHHELGFGMGRDRDRAFVAVHNGDFERPNPIGEVARQLGGFDGDQLRAKAANLIGEQIEIAAGRHRDHAKAIGEARDHVERGDADRTGRADDRDRLHRITAKLSAARSAIRRRNRPSAINGK